MIWEIDPTHSQVSFVIRVMSVTTRGRFNALRGHLHIDEQNPSSSCLTAKATINRKDFGQGMMVRFAASDRATIKIAVAAVQKSTKVPETMARTE